MHASMHSYDYPGLGHHIFHHINTLSPRYFLNASLVHVLFNILTLVSTPLFCIDLSCIISYLHDCILFINLQTI